MTVMIDEHEERLLEEFERSEETSSRREIDRLTQALELSRAEVQRLRAGQPGRPTRQESQRQRSEKEQLRRRAEQAERTAEFSLGRCKVLSRDLRAEKRESERLRRLVRSLGGEP